MTDGKNELARDENGGHLAVDLSDRVRELLWWEGSIVVACMDAASGVR